MKVAVAKPSKTRPDLNVSQIKYMGDDISFVEITLEPSPVLEEMGILERTKIRIGSREGGHKLEISCDVGTIVVEPMSETFILLSMSYG